MKQGIGRALPKIFGVLGAGVLVTGSALLMPALMQSAGATGTGTAGPPTTTHHVQPTYHTGNITSCPTGTTTFISDVTTSVSYSQSGTYFDATVVTSKYVAFTTNSSSFTVYVKGGNGYDTYDYTTTAYPSDTGLHAPLVGNTTNIPNLSHYLVCGQPAVVKASPTLTTHASGPVTLGAAIHDTATLSGGHTPTGTITFHVFSTASCHTALSTFVTAGVSVTGTGKYTSASATPTVAGTYYWRVSYSGDANNAGTTEPCDGAHESVLVRSSAAATGAKPELKVVKNSTPPSTSTVVPSNIVTYTLSLIDSGVDSATNVTVTDTVPAGTTYEATSATCNGISGCTVSEASGMVTWTGLDVAPGQTLAISFQVVVNATDTNGQKIDNVAVFTNRGTPTCTTPTCTTNQVTLTVTAKSSAASGSPPPPPPPHVSSSSGSSTPPTLSPVPGATTAHTGEPFAGSGRIDLVAFVVGLGLLAVGESLRRRQKKLAARGPAE